ncbi:uncharacterized protein LOC131848156 [Achroia grisella]|uniref:uncharacterized protein LOC131848156 n=1 Tax=Achroia grisella TaxID=688607 RepID=UPI0027D30F37|nr:uncharacterized protein LOC131848156 [Achroia grisella]
MEGLLNCQRDNFNRISKAQINFKKSPKDRITESYVETKLDNIEQLWVEFLTTHQQILKDYKWEDVQRTFYVKDEIYDKTEEIFSDYKSTLKRYLKSFNENKISSGDKDSGSSKAGNGSSSAVKLPKIIIPQFSGKYTEWYSFRDLFISLVHSNNSIDDVQKLHYLKGHLTGEVEQLIRHVPITSANYIQCWQQLENRYNNKRYLANCILKRLFSQRSLGNESASVLKELLDTTTDCIHALKNLNIDVSTWDIIIIHIINYKLDQETRKQWELKISAENSNELPTFNQFSEFLQSRFRALECIEPKQRSLIPSSGSYPKTKTCMHVAKINCEFCSETHKLCFCKKFAKLDYTHRYEFVAKNSLCFNCLGGNHSAKFCQSTTICKVCKRRHHSLLHPQKRDHLEISGSGNSTNKVESKDKKVDIDSGETSSNIVSCFSAGQTAVHSQVLLATALVQADTQNGESRVIRALLDQGSQASFITEATAQYLGVKKIPVQGTISGLEGNKNVTAKYMVQLKIRSRIKPEIIIMVQAYVLKTITTFLPNKKVVELDWLDLNEIQLADPQYHTPNKIHILLGAEIYGQIIEDGVKRGPHGTLVAQATSLGWILSGTIKEASFRSVTNVTALHLCTHENDYLKKFWEIESDPYTLKRILTEEEILCEQLYKETTKRDSEGRYIVKLPFKSENLQYINGNSRDIATKRLKRLMVKLNRDETLKEKYTEIIKEYLHLEHMERIPETEKENRLSFYLPHHAVINNAKDTTKVRVVFDASAKNEYGVSLNELLMIGPTLQPELRHLIMRWRIYKICLAADINKMYRQIKVYEQDAEFQRVLWRDNENGTIEDYRLKRLTFGTAAAPYLAVRTLQQVALDEGDNCLSVVQRVKNDFYMDDLLTGCDTVEEGVIIYQEMNQLLQKGGFQLQKWMTNSEDLLNEIKQGNEHAQEGLKIKLDEVVKLLGLTWNRSADTFQYSVNLPPVSGPVTKRKIISEIARLFDPLGWAAPSVIIAKVLIQKLWILRIDWDDEVPNNIINEWHTYRTGLSELTKINIPRWFGTKFTSSRVELHGFSDASKIAYSAAVYIRLTDEHGNIHVTLVSAKTKVAPIKQISVPRLELCGAVLVTRLLVEVAEVLGIPKKDIRAWTDSTVVLAWLNSHPSKWQTFVANRVSEILSTLDSQQWAHITSGQNPADCASRGVSPSDLWQNTMWFNGPEFLHKHEVHYNKPKDIATHLEESKVHLTVTETTLWDRYNSLTRLIRVISYCKRFLNLRTGQQRQSTTFLSTQELAGALKTCIKICQKQNFHEEIAQINKNIEYSTVKGPLKSLNPFIDSSGVLRVGGRLEKSQLNLDAKHPILLPKNSPFTKLIIADAHTKTLHGGPQLMLSFIGTKYYILSAKYLVKAYVRKCVKCIRYSATTSTQLMGQLPTARVSPGRPFQCSGVDYAGPVNVKTTKGRGYHSTKGYICLFICMATKAIHLELVGDLTTQGFLAAFRRFVARRGLCTDIWSDNGTNFVGASRELRTLFASENKKISTEVAEILATQGTTWHFIPPRSPNFGGLWEAGIKSTKFHLRRIVGDLILTYEELSTTLAQIEACLNSRPLSRIDSEQDTINVLTPGHFLIGGPLLAPTDYNFERSNISNLRRWQLVQRLTQDFWRRWSQEYLTRFLHRYRWSHQKPEPDVGDVVLVKEDDLPPCRWLLGEWLLNI